MLDISTDASNIGRFRYYCQKVLPAVYDDSLSYYELLNKFAKYLNDVIENDNQQSDAITELQETLEEFMEGTFDPYIEQKVDEWFTEHEPEIIAIVEGMEEEVHNLRTSVDFSSIYGGDGTLIFDIQDVNENLYLYTTSQHVSRDKKSNELRFDVIIRNETGVNVPTPTPLFKLKNFYMQRYSTLQLALDAIIYRYTSDSDVSDLTNRVLETVVPARISLKKGTTVGVDDMDAYVTCNYNLGSRRELIISGTAPISSLFSWVASSFYNPQLANALCAYFLNGDGQYSWKGTFDYSNNNDVRLDPANLQTDCSGLVYIAYKHFGFHPQNSVQPSYLSDGIFVSYAPKGEKLDLTNAKPGDIICYQAVDNPDRPEYDFNSWVHCTLYAGDNVCYEMALHYPEAETRAGCVDGHGPYAITTPADEYRMNDEINPLTGQTCLGRNRCVVRFL